MTTTAWAKRPPSPAPMAEPRPGRVPATTWALGVMVALGIAFDALARSRFDALAGALFVAAVALALLASGRVRNPQSVALGVAAVPFGCFLAWRTSVWLLPLDAVAALILLAMAASYARGGSVVSITGSAMIVRFGRAVLSFVLSPSYVLGAMAGALPARREENRMRWIAIGRGVGLAVPLLILLGVLLASADAMFGSLFRIPLDVTSVTQHLLLIGTGVMIGSYLLVEASSGVIADVAISRRPLGMTEATVVLGGLVALYATFAAVQVVVALRGEKYVVQTVGVTYAEYARQGFFQLLAVAAVTLGVLVSLRAITARTTRAETLRFVIMAEVAVALTLVIVGVAVVRLGLYEQALGLTMLRYASTWTAWWLAAVFVLTGVALAGVGAHRNWLTFAIGASLLLAVAAWNVADPEAIVVAHNVERAAAVGRLDTAYISQLSDDAVPPLVAALPTLPADQQPAVRSFICRTPASPNPTGGRARAATARPPEPRDGLSSNLSVRRAAAARAQVCPS